MTWSTLKVWTTVFVSSVLACQAHATLVAEWDFRINEDLTYAKPGTTSDAALQGGASIDTGPALPVGFRDQLRTGSLVVPITGTASGLAPVGTNGEWRDYMGAETFGQTTVAMVYKPTYSGVVGAPRRTFFNVNNGSGAGLIWLFHSDGNAGPTLLLGTSVSATLPSFSWDSSKWYFIAGSWDSDADALPNTSNPSILYIREMSVSPTSAQTATSTADLQDPGGFLFTVQKPTIGVREFGGTDEASGRFALVRIYANQYSSVADLDALYMSLLPEPTTATLLVFGAATLMRRRLSVRDRTA